jgi:uncharacterized protein (TIGR00725 family)
VAPDPVREPERHLLWRQRRSGSPIRAPVAVIGPREASAAQLAAAEAVGRLLGRWGFATLTGGREGVMEAASRGAAQAGGLTLGLLPDGDASAANPWVAVPIATGIGEMRNAVIARAAFCLVCVGDSYGTLSEVALGLRFGKTVFGLEGPPPVEGVVRLDAPDGLAAPLARLAAAAGT